MITWKDYAVGQEQHQDQLSKAEKARLVRQMRAKINKPGLWQPISELVAAANQQEESARDKGQRSNRVHLAKESL